MGRHKKQRIVVPREGDPVSRKALNDSAVVYWGNEPTFEPLNPLLSETERSLEFHAALGKAFNWYYAMSDVKHKKSFLVDYVKKLFPELLDKIQNLSIDMFTSGKPHTYALLARCISRGWPIEEKHVLQLDEFIHNIVKTVIVDNQDIPIPEKKVSVRDSKVSECIGIVNGQLDDYGFTKKKFPEASMADTVLKVGATNIQRTKVHEYFSNKILEIQQAISGTDVEIKESYSGIPKPQLKKIYDWFITLPSDDLVQNAKKTRKPRKKKAKTPQQLLKIFTYQKSDDELKIASIDPEGIIGAQQLWVFNSKLRKLGVYYASDEKGLSISRKSIDNYDEATSISKKIRKPKDVIPGVREAGKVALRHMMDEIRATKNPMKGLVSNTTLLLRVIK